MNTNRNDYDAPEGMHESSAAGMGRSDPNDPVVRALTLMGSQVWDGSTRSPRVEEALAGPANGSITVKRKSKVVIAGILVGLVGVTALAAAYREFVQVRVVGVDSNGNRVEFSGVAEVENGVGTMKVKGPNGEDMEVQIQQQDDAGGKSLQVEMQAPANGQATVEVKSSAAPK